jgi:uncharacterized protein YecT (DUF1311 family)
MLRIALTVAALLTTAAMTQDHWNWGTAQDEWTHAPDFAASKAICRRLGHPVAPRADRPTPAQERSLKQCGSASYYYDGKPDYVNARLCAMTEGEPDNPGDALQGSAILMQIYANGLGVPRNLDLATAYACELEDVAAAESNGRVLHLQALKTKPERDPFDYCDDITSGVSEAVCASREAEKATLARDARLKALTDRLPPAAAAQYRAVSKALDAFIEAMVDGELSHSGTAQAAIGIEAEQAVRDQFLRDLTRLLNGSWPAATAAQAKAADTKLNAAYRDELANVAQNDPEGAAEPLPASVRDAQRAWLAYRDAYLRFAAIAAPGISRDAVIARLTNLRTAQLEGL